MILSFPVDDFKPANGPVLLPKTPVDPWPYRGSENFLGEAKLAE
jgi:hypothetical protein